MINRKSAKELLSESFRELSQHKSANKITVREITENCGYSPATFYREFKDKYDLMAWTYAQDANRIIRRIGSDGYTWRNTLLDGALYYWDHQDYFVNLLSHTSGRDSFEHCIIETNYQNLLRCMEQHSEVGLLDPTTDLCARCYCIGTVHLCCEWLMGRIHAAPSEMADAWEQSIPELLLSHLRGA